MSFVLDGESGTTVTVRAKDDRLETKLVTASLSDIAGRGTWAADLFGMV